MNEQPLVSVICLSMNHEKYIEQAILSLTGQTYPNIEYLFLDNNSSDKTFEKASALLAASGRPYKVFEREKSYNVPKNLNFLIQKAEGKYLTFFSGDDWMLPECIDEMISYYEKNSHFGLIYSNGWYHYQDTGLNVLASNKKFVSGKIFDDIFQYGILFPPGYTVKKETFEQIGLYNENVPVEDYEFWLRVASKYEIGYSEKPMIFYRKHSASITGLSRYKYNQYYMEIVDQYKTHPLYKKVSRYYRKNIIYEHFLKGEKSQALKKIAEDFHFERFYLSVLFKIIAGKKN